MTRYTTTDVLICGAGVTGLTLAIELARHGVSFRLIEKRTTPFIGSRGKGIQPRTQEIFEDLGILNKVVAAGGLYPRLRTYRHDGSYVDSDIAHHTKPTHAEPYHLPLMVPQNDRNDYAGAIKSMGTSGGVRLRVTAFCAIPTHGHRVCCRAGWRRGHHRSLFDRRGWRRKLCQKN